MKILALPWVCGLALACVGACSGAAPEAFPSPTSGADSGSGSGGQGSSSNGGGSSGGRSSGGSSGQGSSASGSSSGRSSGGSGGADSGDDGPVTSDDGGSSSGVMDAPVDHPLLCKTGNQQSFCPKGQSCCIATPAFGGATAMCQSTGSCAGTAVRCTATADCPLGQICCGTGTTTGLTTNYTELACTATCPAGTGFTARYQFCDPAANDCPSGKTCTPSTALPGYNNCR